MIVGWSLGFFVVITFNQRVKLYVPKEETFATPLEHIDVVRRTNTGLDVLLECRIDDCWNDDGGQELSEPWDGFTQFTILNEKPPDGHMWSGRGWQKFKQHQGPIFFNGQKCGPECRKLLNVQRNSIGCWEAKARLSKSKNLTANLSTLDSMSTVNPVPMDSNKSNASDSQVRDTDIEPNSGKLLRDR